MAAGAVRRRAMKGGSFRPVAPDLIGGLIDAPVPGAGYSNIQRLPDGGLAMRVPSSL